jgi:hypothetical protein
MVADENGETQFPGPAASAPQPATPGNAPERQRLLDLASDDQQLEVLIDKVLRGSAPRAAAVAVGMSGKVFARRMESDGKFRNLVLRASHEAESSVAQNLYRLATGNSPQAAQSAISWLEKRLPEAWGREPQRVEIEVSGGIDVMAILASPRLIELENAMESERQRLESGLSLPEPKGDIIEGELAEHAPEPFADDETMHVRESRVEVEAPRRNRPGMPNPSVRGHRRAIRVDGIRTEVQDERTDGDDRPPF